MKKTALKPESAEGKKLTATKSALGSGPQRQSIMHNECTAAVKKRVSVSSPETSPPKEKSVKRGRGLHSPRRSASKSDDGGSDGDQSRRISTSSECSEGTRRSSRISCRISDVSAGSLSDLTHLVEEEEVKHRPWAITDFVLGKPLGKGKFGNVYKARQKLTGVNVALKTLFKAPIQDSNSFELLRREVEIQCRLKHENITQLFGYFQDAKSVYLLLEFASGGELYKSLTKSGGRKTSEARCQRIIRDVSAALSYMHRRHVYHRDLKLENLLVGEDKISADGNQERIKIADFGWAVHAPPPNTTRFTLCGTPEYMAPEMIAGTGHDAAVDLWSLGILIFELLLGKTPFVERRRPKSDDANDVAEAEEEARFKTFQKIASYGGNFEEIINSNSALTSRRSIESNTVSRKESNCSDCDEVSLDAKFIIEGLLQPVPQQRLTATQVLDSRWLTT